MRVGQHQRGAAFDLRMMITLCGRYVRNVEGSLVHVELEQYCAIVGDVLVHWLRRPAPEERIVPLMRTDPLSLRLRDWLNTLSERAEQNRNRNR